MANVSFKGFHPWGNQGAAATQCKRVPVASNNILALFWGDCVKRAAGGVWYAATAGAGVAAVAQGASYFDATINSRRENNYLPAATTFSTTVFDDHGETDRNYIYISAEPVTARYVCQYSASTPAIADMTFNANIVAGAGSTTTGLSGHTLDQTTVAVTANLDMAIMDIVHRVNNDTTATSAKVIVQCNVGLVPPFNSAGTIGL